MKKKYRVYTYWVKPVIDEKVITRETDKSVWDDHGNRELKVTSFHEYFDTWEEAHERLLDIAKGKRDSARYQLNQAEGLVGNIKGMKKPAE